VLRDLIDRATGRNTAMILMGCLVGQAWAQAIKGARPTTSAKAMKLLSTSVSPFCERCPIRSSWAM
jgi:hypothetical protein